MTDDEPAPEFAGVSIRRGGRCAHTYKSPRIRTLSNRATAIYIQCHDCGMVLSDAIKKSSFTPQQFAALEPFDDELKNRKGNELSEAQKIAREIESRQRAEAKDAEYQAYLKTPEWWILRQAVMKRDNNICQGCLVRPARDVHHITYDHIFNELLFELVAICDVCHRRCHGYQP